MRYRLLETIRQFAAGRLAERGDDQAGAIESAHRARLAGGTQVSFDVVDVLELAGDGQIAALRIIYYTSGARPVFEAQTGRRSWHSGLPADT